MGRPAIRVSFEHPGHGTNDMELYTVLEKKQVSSYFLAVRCGKETGAFVLGRGS